LNTSPGVQTQPRSARSSWPRRHVVVGLAFVACVVAYTDRVNISVAAVAMREQFGWSQTEKGFVLSSFFVGYLLFMFVGGVLSNRYGGRRILGWSLLAWSAVTLLTPLAAAASIPLLILARICMGIGEAAMFPAAFEMFGRWVPANERSRAAARLLSGIPIGTIVGLSGSGWLVAHFGWPSAFYVFGLLGLIWVVAWFRSVTDDPARDPRVSDSERALLPAPPPRQTDRLDYKRLLLRAPVAAIVAAHFALTWSLYVLLFWLPSYFRDAHGLNIMSAGFYSAAPWIAQLLTSNVAAAIADRMVERGVSITRTRKIMQCGSLIAVAALLLALQQTQSLVGAVTLLCLATGAYGVSWAGFGPAMLDVAPRNSAVVYGFSNTIATIPGIVGVSLTGWLVDVTGSYAAAFILTAIISVVGPLAFGIWFRARPVVE